METIIFDDGFTTEEIVLRLTELCVQPRDMPVSVKWDLSRLTYVPWLKLTPIARALNKLRDQLSAAIKSSLIVLPNNQWRLALSMFFALYKPTSDVQIVVTDADDVEKQLTNQ